MGLAKLDMEKHQMTLTYKDSGESDTTDFMSVLNDFKYDNETVMPLLQRENCGFGQGF